ncbi:DNA replication protein, partial [Pseudoalteromonas sp. MMG012]|nr:DNA replication protein [Pseudoalteromonas sp. MMG012]
MEWLQNSFGISPEEFWGYVEVLHKKELVDLYEDEVVKISDQVLSTYFFYLSVFEKKVISFSSIAHHFYPSFKRTIVDALNPVISAFDHKKVVTEIRSEIKGIFKDISSSGDLKSSIEFLNSFWFALPTETLIFANKLISEMPIVVESWESEIFEEANTDDNEYSLVSLLSSFRNYGVDEFKMSFDLLLQYLSKNKGSLGFVIKTLIDRYNFKPDDRRYGYYVQAHVVDTLVERIDNGDNHLFSKIFLVLAKSFLKVEHTEHQWRRSDTINVITFRLSPNEYLTPIRQKIFKNLSTLMQLPDYEQIIQDFFQEFISRLRFEGKEMAEADLPFLIEFFISNLDHKNTSHCLIMQDLCEHLDALEIKYPSKWKAEFNNATIELSNLLLQDKHEMRLLDMGYEEYVKYRHQCFVDYFSDTSVEKFSEFMSQCVALQNSLSVRERDNSFKVGIEMGLNAIVENHHDQIKEIVSTYIGYDDIFNIQPGSLIFNLFKTLSSSEVWELINSKSYRWKKSWCSFYFSLLPEGDINEGTTNSLLIHLNDTPSKELPAWLDYLSKYQSIDKDIYIKVTGLLVEKSEVDNNYAFSLRQLFNKDCELFGKWFEVFKSDPQLVFSAY